MLGKFKEERKEQYTSVNLFTSLMMMTGAVLVLCHLLSS